MMEGQHGLLDELSLATRSKGAWLIGSFGVSLMAWGALILAVELV